MNEPVKNGLMFLNRVRTSYLYCYEPFRGAPTAAQPNPVPIYKSDFLLAANHVDLVRVAQKIEEIGNAHSWKNGSLTWAQAKEVIKANNAMCLKRGEIVAAGDPTYVGQFVLKGSNKKPFSIYDGARMPIPADSKIAPYAGCWVNAMVDIWAQDNEWGMRINATITGIQFVEHDQAFGGGAKPALPDEFPILAAKNGADAPVPQAVVDPLGGIA